MIYVPNNSMLLGGTNNILIVRFADKVMEIIPNCKIFSIKNHASRMKNHSGHAVSIRRRVVTISSRWPAGLERKPPPTHGVIQNRI